MSAKFKVLVAAIVVCLVAAGCSSVDRRISAQLKRADQLLSQKKLSDAKSQIEAAINLAPRNPDTYRAASGIYIKYERRREAAEILERLLELAKSRRLDKDLSREDFAQLYTALGQLYQEERSPVQAERAYRAALEISPGSAALMNNLAYFYAEEGIRLDEALRLAERAVKLAPNDANIIDTLGWAQYKNKRYADAARTLAEAVRLKPDDPTLRYHLGAAYFELGKLWDSRIELEKALLLDSEMNEAKNLLRTIRTKARK